MTTYTVGTKWEIVDYDYDTDTYHAVECVLVLVRPENCDALTLAGLRRCRYDDLLPVGTGSTCAAEMNA